MSRIDAKNNFSNVQAQAMAATAKSPSADGVAGAAATKRLTRLRNRDDANQKASRKKTKKLHAPSDISETDLQPLMGKKRDDVIAGLTRILMSIQDYEAGAGEDDTTKLCKMMLGEHVRRLTLVETVLADADQLKGSA